jgi:Tc5 transposase DNA-binding domain
MGSIEAALAALALQNQPNYTATALQYNVDRTTLSRRHRGITRSRVDYIDELSLLTQYQQKTLVDYINVLTERGIPPTNTMVRTFAYDISGKWPGKNWVYRFVDAHNDVLQSGYLQGADMSRTKADNIRQYERFFEMVCGKRHAMEETIGFLL